MACLHQLNLMRAGVRTQDLSIVQVESIGGFPTRMVWWNQKVVEIRLDTHLRGYAIEESVRCVALLFFEVLLYCALNRVERMTCGQVKISTQLVTDTLAYIARGDAKVTSRRIANTSFVQKPCAWTAAARARVTCAKLDHSVTPVFEANWNRSGWPWHLPAPLSTLAVHVLPFCRWS
eukprot:COSAG01_NODE_1945_length_8831_cov_4.250000_9_plen_177_part_00